MRSGAPAAGEIQGIGSSMLEAFRDRIGGDLRKFHPAADAAVHG
jgi:hypothetical protein